MKKEKTSNFFWSLRGKKIPMYKLSNKSIIISPKSNEISNKIKSILLVTAISTVFAFLIKQLYFTDNLIERSADLLIESAPNLAMKASDYSTSNGNLLFNEPSTGWLWFLGGTLFAVLTFSILNWRKL